MSRPPGIHVFMDMELNEIPQLNMMLGIMNDACFEAGLKVIEYSAYAFDDSDQDSLSYMLALLLPDSHATVHSWEDSKYMNIDFFFCGNYKYTKAIDVIQQRLNFKKLNIEKHYRGTHDAGEKGSDIELS